MRFVVSGLVMGAVGLFIPAGALGAIEGTVTGPDGVTAVPNFEVELYETSTDNLEAAVCTNASGAYAAPASPGNYYVHFSGDASTCGTPSTFAPEWYNNFFSKTNATSVFQPDGGSVFGIDASLVDGASVAGTVTAAAGGAPIQNVTVDLLDPGGNVVRTECTAADGTYSFDPLAPLLYAAKFTSTGSCGSPGSFAPQWYNGSTTQAGADLLAPSVGQDLTGINAAMVAAPPTDLEVVVDGTGTGTVTSDVGGISCPPSCLATLPQGTIVNLTRTAGAGSAFAGWSGGGCAGQFDCAVTLTADTTVTATFNLGGGVVWPLTVTKSGTGTGTVSSDPAGINCGASCSLFYPEGSTVTLSASATSGDTFTGWTGSGCSGTGTCIVAMTAERSVNAAFAGPIAPPAGNEACDRARSALDAAKAKLKQAKKKLKKAKAKGVAAKIKKAKKKVKKAKAAVRSAQAAVDAAC